MPYLGLTPFLPHPSKFLEYPAAARFGRSRPTLFGARHKRDCLHHHSTDVQMTLSAVSSGSADASFVTDSVRDVVSPAYTGTEEKIMLPEMNKARSLGNVDRWICILSASVNPRRLCGALGICS